MDSGEWDNIHTEIYTLTVGTYLNMNFYTGTGQT